MDSHDFVLVIGADKIGRYANNAFLHLWEKRGHGFVGHDFTLGLSQHKATWYTRQMSRLSPAKPSVTMTVKTPTGSKEREWVRWNATGIFDTNGDLLEVLATGSRVHDFVETQIEKNKLLKTLNAFRRAIDANIICTITDEKGIIKYANRHFCTVSGYTQAEIVGNSHNVVNSGHHAPEFFADLWQTILAGKMWTGEIKNKAKDGSYYWVNSVIIPIRDRKRKITGFLSLRTPIDKEKQMQEEREQYKRSLEEMLYMVSHEIRKPITNSQGIAYIMKEQPPANDEQYGEYVDYLISAAEELSRYSYKLNQYLENNIRKDN